jgi:hypothetical protein
LGCFDCPFSFFRENFLNPLARGPIDAVEAVLPSVDQSQVDKSTELWLDKIEEETDYDAWLCGHWHINKRIGKLNFLYHKVISSEELRGRKTIRKKIGVTALLTTAD